MRGILVAALLALLLVPTAAQAAPTWLAPIDGLDRSRFSLESAGAVLLPAGDLVSIQTHNADHGQLVATTRPPGGEVRAPYALSPAASDIRSLGAALVAAPDGTATAVWIQLDTTSNARAIYASTYAPGGTWTTPETVRATTTGPALTGLTAAVRPGGGLVVGWLEGGRVWTATKSAAAFAAPVQATTVDSSGPRLASGGGALVLTWIEPAASPRVRVAALGADGAPGTPATVQTGAAGEAISQLEAVADDRGEVVLAWRRQRSSDAVVEWALRTSAGFPSAPADVSAAASAPDDAAIALAGDGSGRTGVAWRRGSQVYAARRTTGQAFEAPALLSPNSTIAASSPEIGFDAAGTATVAWTEPQRVFAASAPPGGAWGPQRSIVDTAPSGTVVVSSPPTVALAVAADGDVAVTAATLEPFGDIRTSNVIVGYDVAPPVVSGLSVPATATAGVPVRLSLTALDRWTTPQTIWSVDDGSSDTVGASVQRVFAAPGTYTVRAVSTDRSGNATTVTAPITVTAPPLAAPAPPGPGPTQTPVTTVQRLAAKIALTAKAARTRTRVTGVAVTKLPAGATVQLRCSPRKRCAVKGVRTLTVAKGAARAGSRRKPLAFRPGATLEVRVTYPGRVGQSVRFTFRKGKAPTRRTAAIAPA